MDRFAVTPDGQIQKAGESSPLEGMWREIGRLAQRIAEDFGVGVECAPNFSNFTLAAESRDRTLEFNVYARYLVPQRNALAIANFIAYRNQKKSPRDGARLLWHFREFARASGIRWLVYEGAFGRTEVVLTRAIGMRFISDAVEAKDDPVLFASPWFVDGIWRGVEERNLYLNLESPEGPFWEEIEKEASRIVDPLMWVPRPRLREAEAS